MNTFKFRKNQQFVSFIIPAMNEEATLETLYNGIKKQLELLDYDWEILFIDDGSTDSTWSVMELLAFRDREHVKAYRFPSNKGKADALALGYQVASGNIVFTMDADLQDDPQEIPRFIEALNEGSDIVTGWKRKRHDPWHKVLPSRVFNAVLSRVTGVKLHDHNCGFKAYKKEVVKSLPMYGDMHRMVPSLASFKGFKTTEIEVEHHARQHGVSKYGVERLIIGAIDTVTVGFLQRFRNCPMHFTGKIAAYLVLTAVALFSAAAVVSLIGGAGGILVILGALSSLSAVIVCMQGLMSENSVYRGMEEGRQFLLADIINGSVYIPAKQFSQDKVREADMLSA
ncbi:glycosyltransferase family 2 protein [Rubritalea spongiae]|uniref:Glycosyltransferase family 2 protein n=1 Tax=Rubritalea spongiae TaxID=430797 RepID=A0ABW5E190_9BACT